jgi:hypothetical protein
MIRCFMTQIITTIFKLKATGNLTYLRLKINDISHKARKDRRNNQWNPKIRVIRDSDN